MLAHGGLIGASGVAASASQRIALGSYVGDGADNRAISGLGFNPDFLIARASSGRDAAFRFGSLSGDLSYTAATGAASADIIQSLDADGFTVGTDISVNQNSITYSYAALKTAAGLSKTGSYVGDGNNGRSVSGMGFAPTWLFVKHDSAGWREGVLMIADAATGISFADWAAGASSTSLLSFSSDGFTVGTSQYANNVGDTYQYVCGLDVSGSVKTGKYVGNASSPRAITGVGFQPGFVLVASVDGCFMHLPATAAGTDESYPSWAWGASTGYIVSRDADGFTVGASSNASGTSYYYLCWKVA